MSFSFSVLHLVKQTRELNFFVRWLFFLFSISFYINQRNTIFFLLVTWIKMIYLFRVQRVRHSFHSIHSNVMYTQQQYSWWIFILITKMQTSSNRNEDNFKIKSVKIQLHNNETENERFEVKIPFKCAKITTAYINNYERVSLIDKKNGILFNVLPHLCHECRRIHIFSSSSSYFSAITIDLHIKGI